MWIFSSRSFVSIEAHELDERLLTVRARIRGDIEELFPESDVAELNYDEYRFCASISRERVAEVVASRIRRIDYLALGESIRNPGRRSAYEQVREQLRKEQENLRQKEQPAYEPTLGVHHVYTLESEVGSPE